MINLVLLAFFTLAAHAATLAPREPQEVLIVIGGWTSVAATREVDIITEDLDVISDYIPAVPIADNRWTASLIADEVVVCGGYFAEKDCYNLNLTSKSWQGTSQMVNSRFAPASVVHDSSMYVFGGFWSTIESSVERYNSISNTWSTVSQWEMPEPNEFFCAVEYRNYIYLVGGHGVSDSRRLRRLNTASNGYVTLSSMSKPRHQHACAITTINGHQGILATGGTDTGSNPLSSTEFYRFENNQWVTLADLNTPRRNHGLGIIEGQPVVFGGYNDYIQEHLDSLEVYQAGEDKWLTVVGTKLTTPKQLFAYVKAILSDV